MRTDFNMFRLQCINQIQQLYHTVTTLTTRWIKTHHITTSAIT